MQKGTKGCSQWCKISMGTCSIRCAVGLCSRSPVVSFYAIMVGIESEFRLFADECVCYRQIDSIEDTSKLQKDIDQLGKWVRKWDI